MFGYVKVIFDFREPKKQLLRLILISFLLSFFIARFFSVFIGASVYFKGYHIHHFYFGTLALSVGGVIGILGKGQRILKFASVLLGTGIGLFADEIGLLLNCTTNTRTCAYAFPNTGDIISSIALAIFLIMIAVDIHEGYQTRKRNKSGSV